jgi:PAS domain S-box-containing protein
MLSDNYLSDIFRVLPAPGLIFLPDAPKYTILAVNDAYLHLARASKSDFLGRGVFEAIGDIPYLKIPGLENILEKVIKEKQSEKTPVTRYEIPVSGRGKIETRYMSVENTPVVNENNEVGFIIASITDVTELVITRQNETVGLAQVIDNEKLLHETQRIAKIGSWEIDVLNHRVIWSQVVNEIHEADADHQPDQVTHSPFYEIESVRYTFEQAVKKSIQNNILSDTELKITTARGNERWVRVAGKTDVENGQCIRVYGVLEDITARKTTEQELVKSRNQFLTLIQTAEGIVWEADARDFKFIFVSDQVKSILGYSASEWIDEPDFWVNHIHPEDRHAAVSFCHTETEKCHSHTLDYRMTRADGRVIWIKDMVSVISENGKPRWLRGLMVDITETKRFTDLEVLEKTILELNSQTDVPIEEVLEFYTRGIEHLFPKMRCSILQIKNKRLHNWSSHSLPVSYVSGIEGLAIGANTGSCGTAAFLKERVIVHDISTDPIWEGYRDLALVHDLHACWSHPIISNDGKVLATFGIYYNEVKLPDEEELKIIDRSVAILKVILENRQNYEIIQETTILMKQGQELAHFGNWQWDIQNDIVTWSDTLYTIYGLDKKSFVATFEGYQQLLHPDDRERIYNLISGALTTLSDVEFEERIIRPSGEIRHLKTWGKVKSSDGGIPAVMIGACLDITEGKKIQEELLASEARLRISNERYEYVNKATNDAIYDWDIVGDDIVWGEGYYRLFGFRAGDAYPITKLISLIHPDELEKARISLTLHLDNKYQNNWSLACQFRKANGMYAYVETNAYILRDELGKAIRMIGVLRDVTRQKQEEHRLRLLESVVTDTNDSVLIAEADPLEKTKLKIVYANDAFTNMTGYTFGEVQGKTPLVLNGINPDINHFSRILRAIRSGESVQLETKHYKKSGEYFWISLSLNPIADSRGVLTHWICIGHDVTERLNYIRAIEKQNKKFQEIAWMQSHVVRAPLARIMGLVDLIKNYQNSEIEKSEILDHILYSAREFDHIVRDISRKTEQYT